MPNTPDDVQNLLSPTVLSGSPAPPPPVEPKKKTLADIAAEILGGGE